MVSSVLSPEPPCLLQSRGDTPQPCPKASGLSRRDFPGQAVPTCAKVAKR